MILDSWMAELSGAEFKVLLYIARRTYGFGKESDSISLHPDRPGHHPPGQHNPRPRDRHLAGRASPYALKTLEATWGYPPED